MKVFSALILLTVVFYVPTAWAQCTTGVDTGGQCIPPDALPGEQQNNQQPQPEQPRVVWETRWGAFADDEGTSSIGISENQTSKSAASAEAMQRCGSKSNSTHCQVTYTYRNGCAALALGTHIFNAASDTGLSQADSRAMDGCSKGAADCKIVYHGCSLPVRVQ